MFDICFDLTAVDLAKPDFAEALAYEQFGSSDMIWRQRSIRSPFGQAHLISGQICDIETITVTATDPANVPDVVTEK